MDDLFGAILVALGLGSGIVSSQATASSKVTAYSYLCRVERTFPR